MKKQMKTNLAAAVAGFTLLGAFLMSATNNPNSTVAHQPLDLKEQSVSMPVAAKATTLPSEIPFTVYLSLVIAFTNGNSIDFNAMDEDGQSSIWEKMNQWREEH